MNAIPNYDLSADRFAEPTQNDENGQCIPCGRDNKGHEGEPCIDECPFYWEVRGLTWGVAA